MLQEDYLTPQQVVAYASRLEGELRLLFCVLLGTGLRAAELCALQVRDVAVEMGRSEITVRSGKGNKARTIFIDEQTAQLLKQHITDKPKRSGGKAQLFVNRDGEPLSY